MNILHLLVSGTTGGVEKQCYNELISSEHHFLYYIKKYGKWYDKSISFGRTYGLFDGNFKLKLNNVRPILKSITKYAEDNKIEKVIIEHPGIVPLIVGLKLKKLGYNVYVYMHCSYYDYISGSYFKKKAINFLYKKSIKKLNGVIAISQFVKKTIIEYTKCAKYSDKIHVIYNGTILHEENEIKRCPRDEIKFLYVGRIVEEKGIPNIINCLNKIKLNYKFYIVGTGCKIEEYKKLYENENIIFCGEVIEIEKIYKKCDIFVHLPNYNEGFGITLIEAFNYGLPIISNYKGAIPEIVKDNFNGILLNNYSDFNDAVNNILTYYNEYSLNSINDSKKYSIKKTLKKLEQL